MRTSKVLARAGKGLPTLRASRQQNPLLTRAASSSSSVPATGSLAIGPLQTRSRQLALSTHSTLPIQSIRNYASAPESLETAPLQKTPLYDFHMAHGAKMVPFGGFYMPVQYAGQSVIAEHHFTRTHASLFDVGHMVQHHFSGPGATAFLQRITPAGLEALPERQSTLSAFLWPSTGGIVDDTIVTKIGADKFYVVTNAACRDKDLKYLAEQLDQWRKERQPQVDHQVLEGRGLVALQGPLAEQILSEVLLDPAKVNLRKLYFGQSRVVQIKAPDGHAIADVRVSRGGYTGEDGFELSVAGPETQALTEALFKAAGPERLRLAGLGARDSLRLEAGMCLYGHDLDDTTTPVEGGLSWIIAKDRRDFSNPEAAFHGANVILTQLTPTNKGGQRVQRRRVGLLVEGAPAREGATILDAETGDDVGVVTSGCPSPTLGANIAMGYIESGLHKARTEVAVLVRGRRRKAIVTKMPFVPTKYWKGTAPA
ncbi:Aminomethyltransferase, mitochondrial [Parahypoxylon ruwenzoriense]